MRRITCPDIVIKSDKKDTIIKRRLFIETINRNILINDTQNVVVTHFSKVFFSTTSVGVTDDRTKQFLLRYRNFSERQYFNQLDQMLKKLVAHRTIDIIQKG